MNKVWWQSKTVWFGIAEAAIGGIMVYEDYLEKAIDGSIAGWVLFASGIAKIVLRTITQARITLKRD